MTKAPETILMATLLLLAPALLPSAAAATTSQGDYVQANAAGAITVVSPTGEVFTAASPYTNCVLSSGECVPRAHIGPGHVADGDWTVVVEPHGAYVEGYYRLLWSIGGWEVGSPFTWGCPNGVPVVWTLHYDTRTHDVACGGVVDIER